MLDRQPLPNVVSAHGQVLVFGQCVNHIPQAGGKSFGLAERLGMDVPTLPVSSVRSASMSSASAVEHEDGGMMRNFNVA